MNISITAKYFLMRLEGVQGVTYSDVSGHTTIGVGHKLTEKEIERGEIAIGSTLVKYKDGLTDDQIADMFHNDIIPVEQCISDSVTVPLTQQQFDALCIFAFNIGITAFKKSTLLRLLNRGQYSSVPAQMLRWVYSDNSIIPGLRSRRHCEANLWQYGYESINEYFHSHDKKI